MSSCCQLPLEGVPADKDHLLEAAVLVSPSCGVVYAQGHPLPVEGEMEGLQVLQSIRTVSHIQEVGVDVGRGPILVQCRPGKSGAGPGSRCPAVT